MNLYKNLTNLCETLHFDWCLLHCNEWAVCPNEPTTNTIMKACFNTLSAMALATSLSFAADKPKGPPHGPGPEGRPKPEEIFKKLDANGDGNITLDEFKKGPKAQEHPEKAEEVFKKIDANSDGNITLEEFKAHRPPPHPPGKGGPGKDGPPKGGGGGTTPPAE